MVACLITTLVCHLFFIVFTTGTNTYFEDNLFGTMMSTVTHNAMLARRPGLRTLVVTRSTFAGAGRYVQKWLGDNLSDWPHYLNSIAGILNMASVFHVPMAGADICGYGTCILTDVRRCLYKACRGRHNRAIVRTLGNVRCFLSLYAQCESLIFIACRGQLTDNALQHNTLGTISQEFYRWPVVAEAARNALDMRYAYSCTML